MKQSARLNVLVFFITTFAVMIYILVYLMGMISGDVVSKYVAISGAFPAAFFVIWSWMLGRNKQYKPVYGWYAMLFVCVYPIVGFAFFGYYLGEGVLDRVSLFSLQLAVFVLCLMIGRYRFNSEEESRKQRNRVVVSDGVIYYRHKVESMSYSRQFESKAAERIFQFGYQAFALLVFFLSILGGGAGFFLISIFDSVSASPHILGMYSISFLVLAFSGYGLPYVVHVMRWWWSMERQVANQYGKVEYVFEES